MLFHFCHHSLSPAVWHWGSAPIPITDISFCSRLDCCLETFAKFFEAWGLALRPEWAFSRQQGILSGGSQKVCRSDLSMFLCREVSLAQYSLLRLQNSLCPCLQSNLIFIFFPFASTVPCVFPRVCCAFQLVALLSSHPSDIILLYWTVITTDASLQNWG